MLFLQIMNETLVWNIANRRTQIMNETLVWNIAVHK